jgi:hypothetical protein
LAMYAGDIMTVSISFLLTKFLSHTSDYMWTRQIVLSWGLDLCYWTSTPLNSCLIQTWVIPSRTKLKKTTLVPSYFLAFGLCRVW